MSVSTVQHKQHTQHSKWNANRVPVTARCYFNRNTEQQTESAQKPGVEKEQSCVDCVSRGSSSCAPCRCRRRTTGKRRSGPPRSCSAPSQILLSSSWPTGWRWEPLLPRPPRLFTCSAHLCKSELLFCCCHPVSPDPWHAKKLDQVVVRPETWCPADL